MSHDLAESRLRSFLGGIGLGTSLLCDYAPTGVDPFSPANPLIFTSAPLVGTGLTTTAKFGVVTKSPLTGFIGDSLSSSHFALELKRAALDAVVITGQAASMIYLLIHDDKVEIHAAEHLRGKSPRETEVVIQTELNSATTRVAAIGTAGENRVRFATISNEGRHAGRGGVGAVMGSKNLKAIALCGERDSSVFDSAGVNVIASLLRRRSLSSLTDKYRNIGTVANLAVFNRLGVLPAHNFQQSTFEDSDALSGESLSETTFARRHGCASCSIRCERLFKSLNGEEQRLEYETLFALGPLCGIKDPNTVLEAAHLCDLYGMDTISTGGTLAWAMECGEKGLLPEAEKLGLCFGRPEGILNAIPAIATRTGLGALLAEGSKRAALELGGDSSDWAMHALAGNEKLRGEIAGGSWVGHGQHLAAQIRDLLDSWNHHDLRGELMDHTRGNRNISPAQPHLYQRRTGGKVNLDVTAEQSRPARRTRQIDRFHLQAMLLEQFGLSAHPEREYRSGQRSVTGEDAQSLLGLGKCPPENDDNQQDEFFSQATAVGSHF